MVSKYKENNFSLKNFSTSLAVSKKNTVSPNIDNLIKKILVERKRERINIISLGFVCLLVVVVFHFF